MDILGMFDDDNEQEDLEEEDQDRREREEKLKIEKMEAEEKRKRRREAEQEAEDRWYHRKESRIEILSLAEHLERKKVLIPVELKENFKSTIPRIVEHFDTSGEDLRCELGNVTEESQLIRFICSRHMPLVTDPQTREKMEMQRILEFFHKEIVEALKEMTGIPKNEKLQILSAGNVFVDAKEKAEKTLAMQIDMDHFSEKCRLLRLKEEEENRLLEAQNVEFLQNLGLEESKSTIAQLWQTEVAAIAVNSTRYPVRETSPPRIRVSSQAEEQICELFRHFYVDPSIRETGNSEDIQIDDVEDEEEGEGDDFMEWMTIFEEGGAERKKNSKLNRKIPPPRPIPRIENLEESDDEEDPNFKNWKQILNYQDRGPLKNCGRTAAKEHTDEWIKYEFEDRRKKKSIVKFVEFEDPRNKMRLFVKPLERFFSCGGDDSPITDYVDLSLQKGMEVIKEKCKKPLVVGCTHNWHIFEPSTVQRITNPVEEWQKGYHGSLLGRFWFSREKKSDDQLDKNQFEKGFLTRYTIEELCDIHRNYLETLHNGMRRGLRRQDMPIPSSKLLREAPVAGVLILTDWRLAHLVDSVVKNAIIQYLPTNLGGPFFDAMAEYLIELLRNANLDFHTIIFAFGGTPQFKIHDFMRFWKQLTIHTNRCIDVCWTAQDWIDGGSYEEREKMEMDYFNDYVEKVFAKMNENGFKNYKWCNIRREKEIPYIPLEDLNTFPPDTTHLEKIYLAYINYFADEGNVYVHKTFFPTKPKNPGEYAENDARFSRR